ncbi:hypothetical protein AVEN_1418-1 [Araneus ventricosus]|uniref:Uncharacterized protein n=1 Tax=Araneus ventricosus TaxID=182803 RepID=A0A4Y2SUB3_ARAVE|nr:hypothetical protein AVEN_1418-1 [Araneus ventricosus]
MGTSNNGTRVFQQVKLKNVHRSAQAEELRRANQKLMVKGGNDTTPSKYMSSKHQPVEQMNFVSKSLQGREDDEDILSQNFSYLPTSLSPLPDVPKPPAAKGPCLGSASAAAKITVHWEIISAVICADLLCNLPQHREEVHPADHPSIQNAREN